MSASTRVLAAVLVIFLAGGAVAYLWTAEWLRASIWGSASLLALGFLLVWPWIQD